MSEEQETDDELDHIGDVVGRDFIDKLLIAIIDAYSGSSLTQASDEKQRAERLRQAREALFGLAASGGRPSVSDEAILRWMGNERYKDLARQGMARLKREDEPKLRSNRSLAAHAVTRFGLLENAAERLREKFGTQEQKWISVASYHDDVPEALDFSLLEQIQAILVKRDIKMDLKRIER